MADSPDNPGEDGVANRPVNTELDAGEGHQETYVEESSEDARGERQAIIQDFLSQLHTFSPDAENKGVTRLSSAVAALLMKMNKPLTFFGEEVEVAEFAAPDGLLPVLLLETDTIWRRATGQGLGLALAPYADGFSGMGVADLPKAPLAVVLCCSQYAIEKAATKDAIVIDDLVKRWFPHTRAILSVIPTND